MDWLKHLDLIVGAALSLLALAFSKHLWQVAGWVFRKTGLPRLVRLVETVERIDAQLSPNGGKSLHDAVHHIRDDLSKVQGDVAKLSGALQVSWDTLGHVGVFYAAPDGAWTYVSTLLARWLGREHLTGLGWLSCVHPSDREAVKAEWGSCLRDRRDFLMRFALGREDGTVMDVIATATPVPGTQSPDPVMWVGTVRKAIAGETLHTLSRDEE